MKTAFLFSGQGSQYPLMGKELLEIYPGAKEIYSMGSDILGFDLKKACFEYDEEKLANTTVAQPAIYATSLVALFAAKENDIAPTAVAGHSLGEYAAMVCAGIVSAEDGFKLLKLRCQAMDKCAKSQKSAMYAVIGTNREEAESVCDGVSGYVIPANFNSPTQIVISGEEEAAAKAAQEFTNLGRRAVRLNVSAAFHSKLMAPAAEEFKQGIADFKFSNPSIDFYSNLTGKRMTDFSDMPSYLASHITSPVMFSQELEEIFSSGIQTFVELGPGKVLTGLVRKTLKGAVALNIEDKKSLDKTIEAGV